MLPTDPSPDKFSAFPEGTVTFLFTDIEGSTELLKQLGDQYAELLEEQRRIVRACFEKWDGTEVDTQGDSFFLSFPRATQAVSAAVEIQKSNHEHPWPEGAEVRLRMGLHTGEPLTWAEGYVGIDVHRAARIAAIGHGGQVLLSQTTTPLVQENLPEGVRLIDLGRHRLKDLRTPERLGQLVIEGLPAEFPPLKSLEALPAEVPLELTSTRPPEFLKEGAEPPARPIFVARERELAWLDERLEMVLGGEGQIAMITGGPGRGKSALLEAFMRRAMAAQPELLAVRGESSAHTGIGDPYQPFRGALGMLLGDLEGAWASGILERENALRLWEAMPRTAQLLLEVGPDLLDVFVPGRTLLSRLQAAVEGGSSWLERLAKKVEAEPPTPGELAQRNLFEQVEGLLIELSEKHPIVLALDDLQWADAASVNLLFQLGRRLKRRRILIIGAYRLEEVAVGRAQAAHPLEKVVGEFKRLHGEIELDLSSEEDEQARGFVRALLDSEPNKLTEEFQAALFAHTGGHPLFTIELLRVLQEREVLVKDEAGEWILAGDMDWGVLPARVEGVIEERLGRLEPELRELLAVASVEGLGFSAQVVADVGGVDTAEVVGHLSTSLAKVHRLVSEQGVVELPQERVYQYRFRHQLFQQHLYNSLGAFRHELLHGKVGRIKERLYGDRVDEIASELANHFTLSGDREKAIEYLLRAGDRARMIYAQAEAVDHYQRALELLQQADDAERTARTYMKLGLVYTANFQAELAQAAYNRAFDLWERAWKKGKGEFVQATREIRFAISEPLTLDPGRMHDDVSTFIARQLFEGLTRVDAERSILPAVASRWEVLDEGQHYRFHLREGIFWSDGRPLTAADFEYAWKRNLRLPDNMPSAGLLYVIEGARTFREDGRISGDDVGVRAIDDLTLDVRLGSPCAYLPHLLTLPIAYPLPRWIIDHGAEDWTNPEYVVGNGPYRLSAWDRGVRLEMEHNPHYLGTLPGNISRIHCPFLGEFTTAFDDYQAGTLDGVSMIASDPLSAAEARSRFDEELRLTPHASTLFLFFRMDRPPFNDMQVRRAFAHALDRKTLVRETLRGLYAPATGGLLPPSLPAHSPGIAVQYKPAEGRKLIKESVLGKEVAGGNVELIYAGGSEFDPLVSTLRASWGEHLGVEVSLTSVDWPEFFKRLEVDPAPMGILGFSADYPDPDAMLRVLFHSTDGYNLPGWRNEVFDRLVGDAARMADPLARLDAYREADRILIEEEVAVLPLGYAQGRTLLKSHLNVPPVAPMWMLFKEMSKEMG
jgi:ABC-type oligopeptide transport system substrate-binding subunit/class 3 adenylate cyclase